MCTCHEAFFILFLFLVYLYEKNNNRKSEIETDTRVCVMYLSFLSFFFFCFYFFSVHDHTCQLNSPYGPKLVSRPDATTKTLSKLLMLCRLNVWPDRWLKIPVLSGGLGTSNGDTGMGSSRKSASSIESKNPKVEVVRQMDPLNKVFAPEFTTAEHGLISDWTTCSDEK